MKYNLDVYLNSGQLICVPEVTGLVVDGGDLSVYRGDIVIAIFAEGQWTHVISHQVKTPDED